MEAVQAPAIPTVMDLVRATPGTISLGQGVVSWGPPPQARDAVGRFFADPDNHKYKAAEGIPLLQQAISAKLRSENSIQVGGASRLVVTAGGNMAFFNAVLAIADPGDEIVLQRPYYFNHEMAVTMASCRPVLVDTDDDYQLRLDAIARALTDRTRAVVTVSPNNPTGAVYAEAALREVNQLCRARGIYHIHDEAYEYFTFDGARSFSPGSLPDSAGHTISLYSLSKAYGFASWRIGYMVIPEGLLDAVRKIQDTNIICPPVVAQHAAVGALEAGAAYCRERLAPIGEVRRTALAELSSLGSLVTVPRTQGAFYFFIRANTANVEPMAIVRRLITEHRVAVMPGTTFGVTDRCSIRIAFGALETATAAEGIGRLCQGLREILG
jgi:aspartate/methionine/tyrosine aminotransferase